MHLLSLLLINLYCVACGSFRIFVFVGMNLAIFRVPYCCTPHQHFGYVRLCEGQFGLMF